MSVGHNFHVHASIFVKPTEGVTIEQVVEAVREILERELKNSPHWPSHLGDVDSIHVAEGL